MLETKVDGAPGDVEAAANWLRSRLKGAVTTAGDKVQVARSMALDGWEGDAGDAYRGYARGLVAAADDLAPVVERAASKFELYAHRLRTCQDRMADSREKASAGGLNVSGTVIAEPPTAVGPSVPSRALSTGEQAQLDQAMAAYEVAAAKVELYNRLIDEVVAERESFTQWIAANLTPARAEIKQETSGLDKFRDFLKDNAHALLIGFTTSGGEKGLGKRAKELMKEAEDLRKLRRSGHPGRRAEGNKATTKAKVKGLGKFAEWAGKGGKAFGPIGIGLELWNAYGDLKEGKSPGKVITSTAASIGAGMVAGAAIAGITASSPAWGTALAVGFGAAVVGVAAGAGAAAGWDALPDSFTDSVDEGIKDGWNGATDGVENAWDWATGWV
ncbi:hypothetical protein [Nocardioides sp. YR527]|uniref:hypothetical protein n=1 Tax=Nocardioides sp. YR527 TaxID=1881028 RepID=UPI00115FD0CB|nr:hypothetical protein [Nocardioides sp. YR527]